MMTGCSRCRCRDFPVRLENSHVIGRDQIFVSIIGTGPDGVSLSSAFDQRSVCVARVQRVTPELSESDGFSLCVQYNHFYIR